MQKINEFIGKFTDWYMTSYSNTNREAFKAALRKAILTELPSRNNLLWVQIRDIEIDDKYRIAFDLDEFWVGNSSDGLFCGCLRPNWARGWSHFTKHAQINDIISNYFHFCSQYIVRSRQINLIGAVNIVYGIDADFRHTRLSEIPVEIGKRNILKEKEIYGVSSSNIKSRRHRELVSWFGKINSLDPLINRLIFNLNRSIKLRETYLIEEIITALDKTINVAEQYWKERVNNCADIRATMMSEINFDEFDKMKIMHLYDLRCYFGAHPSHSKWWDISEIYENDLEYLYETVCDVVKHIVVHENSNRVVINNPDDWSTWFNEYCLLLWKSVWFETVPPNFS